MGQKPDKFYNVGLRHSLFLLFFAEFTYIIMKPKFDLERSECYVF
jgi:hypothetical protein